jgi:hypothetical protein
LIVRSVQVRAPSVRSRRSRVDSLDRAKYT